MPKQPTNVLAVVDEEEEEALIENQKVHHKKKKKMNNGGGVRNNGDDDVIVGRNTKVVVNSSNSYSNSSSSSDLNSVDSGGRLKSVNDEVNQFKPTLSCYACRKLHRKCDKKQPQCSECLVYARECKYTPGKNKQYIRKKKKVDENSEEIENNSKYLMVWNQNMTPQTQWADTFVKNSVKKQTVDVYYRKLSMGMSTIQQMKMEELFFRNGTEELDNDEYSLALFYSIQALCDQYMGRGEKSIEAFNECRKYLGKIFDDLESFTVACTCNYLAYFLAGEGEDEISRNYLTMVDQYFNRRNRKIAQGLPCFGNSEHFIVNNLDKKRGVTSIFFYDNRLEWDSGKRYSDLVGVAYKISTGNELPQQFIEILDSDLNEHTYQQQMAVLDDIHILMKKSHKGRSHVPEYAQLGLVMDKLNVALHRMEALRVVLSKNPTTRRNVKLALLKEADDISELVENTYFTGMLTTFIFAFAASAQVHFELFFDNEIADVPSIKMSILDSLKRDLKGLKYFASKYRRTTKVYGHIMNAIEAIILNVSSTNPSESSLSDSISTNTSVDKISSPSNESAVTSQKRRDLPSAQFLANTMQNFKVSKKL